MQRSGAELEAESWAFALEIYAQPGVADACLTLQNEARVDVMILLMALFAALKHHMVLSSDEIGKLNETCRPWREQIVRPLRAIRSGLKTDPAPAPSSTTEPFRSSVKAVELAAEKLQNQLLSASLPQRPPQPEAVSADALRAVVGSVVALFLEKQSQPIAAFSSPIETIVQAAMRQAR